MSAPRFLFLALSISVVSLLPAHTAVPFGGRSLLDAPSNGALQLTTAPGNRDAAAVSTVSATGAAFPTAR